MPPSTLRLAAASLLLLACQRIPQDEDPGPEDDTGSTDSQPTTSGGGDDGDQAPLFGCEPGDPGACPTGQKCTAVSEGGPQNHFECVTDDGELLPGEECQPQPGTGLDGCSAGHVCLVSAAEATLGRCVALCSSDDDCEPGKCTVSPYTLTPFCADACDPLQPECDIGRLCLQADDRFICGIANQESDIGVTAAECNSLALRGCAEGYACLAGQLIPDCSFNACCTDVCDLGGGQEQCVVPAQCKPLFPEPAPGFENLGACYVPT